ncbi:hypothetical protein FB547_110244 [Variovorax beijingensis]|uniref:Uncharacterized protein n=1 Tax=Variovorax beijingensis TaxID=2496117 RepID=A0A561BEW0_9BURK|nr:hypothetical protein [Variovorax beijingensis]TWD77282.1 hypothetical protein FB547_110244 [Variovorax beijingensis]
MQALEVLRNGQPLVVAGTEDAVLLSFSVHMSIDGEHPATLDMRGMRDLGNGRQAHLEWIQELPLGVGDEICVTLLEVEEVTPPAEDIASDSDEHIAAHAAYESQLASGLPVPRALERKQPDASLEILVGDAPVVATFDGGRELVTMRVDWNRWRPERCHLSLRSFSVKEGLAREEGKNWLTASAARDQVVLVRLGPGHA